MSSSAFTPSTTTVTNNVPVNVPVVETWQSYTPTFGNFGTVTGISAWYRRVGDSIQIKARYVTGTTVASAVTISLPSALNTDASKSGFLSMIVGKWYRDIATSANRKSGVMIMRATSSNVLAFGSDDYNSGVAPLTELSGTAIAGSGETHVCEFTVPIAEWAGSGTTTLATRAVEEYAWNSDTTNTSTTSSGFSNGPDGVQFGSYSTATRTKRVRFQTSILPTDTIILETKDSANSQWMPYHQSRYISTSGTTGMGCNVVSSTEVDVFFASAGYASTVYSPTAAAWSGIAGSDNFKWRVRKVSGGAQVGYPVSARNIVGDTSGSVVPVGMIGELKSLTAIMTPIVATWSTSSSLFVTKGTYFVTVFGAGSGNTGTRTAQSVGFSTDSTATTFTDQLAGINVFQGAIGTDGRGHINGTSIVTVANDTNYYIKALSFGADCIGGNNHIMKFVRIA